MNEYSTSYSIPLHSWVSVSPVMSPKKNSISTAWSADTLAHSGIDQGLIEELYRTSK